MNKSNRWITLKVWVHPNSSKNEIKGFRGDILRIGVTSPPIEGRANKACMDFLAKELGVGKSQVEIIRGRKSRTKTVKITGVTLDEIKQILTTRL